MLSSILPTSHPVSSIKGTIPSVICSCETSPLELTVKVSCVINDFCKAFDLVSVYLFSSTSLKRNVSQIKSSHELLLMVYLKH